MEVCGIEFRYLECNADQKKSSGKGEIRTLVHFILFLLPLAAQQTIIA